MVDFVPPDGADADEDEPPVSSDEPPQPATARAADDERGDQELGLHGE